MPKQGLRGMKDEDSLLGRLGIKAISATQMEHRIEQEAQGDLLQQQQDLEEQRLVRIRDAIQKLEARITSRLTPARLAQLMDRIDELRSEEQSVIDRMKGKGIEEAIDTTDLKQSLQAEDVSNFLDFDDQPSIVKKIKVKEPDNSDAESEDEDDDDALDVDDLDEKAYVARAGQDALVAPIGLQTSSLSTFALSNNWRVPLALWDRLLPYQQEGVRWAADMIQEQEEGATTGGILGDEMGLGKTVQVVAMVAMLLASGRLKAPVLIVAPATLLKQWRREFHAWAPHLRCLVLHSPDRVKPVLNCAKQRGHLVITSYGYLLAHGKALQTINWRMAVLDEGHRIRNPEAAITKAAKSLRAHFRLVVSGTPIQNNLVELWSLVDFCRPGWLGHLPLFKAQMALPIAAGGWLNATSLQIHTAYRCALALRELLKPILLRRIKEEVAKELPLKDEQILFCPLTAYQRHLYERVLRSDAIQAVLEGKRNVLAGIDLLRKVCNHPSLLLDSVDRLGLTDIDDDDLERGNTLESGKMRVLQAVLEAWQEEGHRVLIFCQTRQMLDLLEASLSKQFTYRRLDGCTPISQRIGLVEEFNSDPSIFCLILTTRVGGLGLNLIGADRVIIYDPDWNPSTDLQARERAWRLGQTRPVTIYRLLSGGTIEEKIYHRQIYKHFLSNRILSDPKQIGFVRTSHLQDLFSLDNDDAEVETKELISHDEVVGDHVLKSLFAATGLQAALPHDKLTSSASLSSGGAVSMEREAQRIAEQAVSLLKQSAPSSSPWLSPTNLSSAKIIAAMRSRKGELSEHHQSMLNRLVTQLRDHGPIASDRIARLFETDVDAEDAAVFRQMLRAVATFDSRTRRWRLNV